MIALEVRTEPRLGAGALRGEFGVFGDEVLGRRQAHRPRLRRRAHSRRRRRRRRRCARRGAPRREVQTRGGRERIGHDKGRARGGRRQRLRTGARWRRAAHVAHGQDGMRVRRRGRWPGIHVRRHRGGRLCWPSRVVADALTRHASSSCLPTGTQTRGNNTQQGTRARCRTPRRTRWLLSGWTDGGPAR